MPFTYTAPDGHAVNFSLTQGTYKIPDGHALRFQMNDSFITLYESASATAQAAAYRFYNIAAASIGRGTSAPSMALGFDLTGTAGATATAIANLAATFNVEGSADAVAQAILGRIVLETLLENVVAQATANANLTITELIQEIVTATFAWFDANAPWTGWAFDSHSFAAARYENFPFNSFAKLNGVYYGCTSAGVFALGGATDNGAPIGATLTTGYLDMDSTHNKGVTDVFLAIKMNGQMQVKCIVKGQSYVYAVDRINMGGVSGARIVPGKGLRSTTWQFEIANVNGADFDLANIVVYPVMTSRHF